MHVCSSAVLACAPQNLVFAYLHVASGVYRGSPLHGPFQQLQDSAPMILLHGLSAGFLFFCFAVSLLPGFQQEGSRTNRGFSGIAETCSHWAELGLGPGPWRAPSPRVACAHGAGVGANNESLGSQRRRHGPALRRWEAGLYAARDVFPWAIYLARSPMRSLRARAVGGEGRGRLACRYATPSAVLTVRRATSASAEE